MKSIDWKGSGDLWGFFIFSHGWSWTFWGTTFLIGQNVWTYPSNIFIYIGGVGPFLAGLIMTQRTHGSAGLRDLWRRLIDVKRINFRWYMAIFLLIPCVSLSAAAIYAALGASSQALDFEVVRNYLGHPMNLLVSIFFFFVFGPLPEEIGWRGYALDRFQVRWSAFTSSLLLGVAWGVWHVPLFLMQGYYSEFGATPDPVFFMYNILLSSILLTWIYNNTQRSVLAVALFHFMTNFTGESLPTVEQLEIYKTVLMTIVVLIVVIFSGASKLQRRAGLS